MQTPGLRVTSSISADKTDTLQSITEALGRKTSSKHAGVGSFGNGSWVYGRRRNGNTVDTKSPQRDSLYWAALLSEHTKRGQGRHALRIYDEMRQGGVRPSSHAFVAALKACSSLKDLERARQIHADVVECGFESDLYVGNTLIDVYAKCGSLVDARDIFEKKPRRDVVSWNSMIFSYVQLGKGEEALQLFARMQQEAVLPSDRTFVGALKACCSLAASNERKNSNGVLLRTECLEQVRAIHSQIVKSGCDLDIFVGTMLVDVYVKCGSLLDARHVFDKMPHRDAVSWNAMILGYAQMEEGEEALYLYAKMEQEGVVPNERTFVGALKACRSVALYGGGDGATRKCLKRRCVDQIRAIHLQVTNSGSLTDLFVGTMLVDAYAKCGSLLDARRVFEKMPRRDVVCWNAMIMGYAQMGEGKEALRLYGQMQQEGVVPDAQAYVAAIKACSSLLVLEEGNGSTVKHAKERCLTQVDDIHSDILKSGLNLDTFMGTMLVDVYAKCGSLQQARLVFDRMPHRDVVSWNAMIQGYAQMEEGEEALQLYADMQREGVVPNDQTFLGALKACGTIAGLEKGRSIHAQIVGLEHEDTSLFVANSLIDMYSKCGSMAEAQEVFDALHTRDVVTWSALIAGYAHQGDSLLVIDFFQGMTQEGIQPDGITFLSVLSACCQAGLVVKAQEYFESMTKTFGITPTIDHYTCMIDILGRAGQVDQAMRMVNTMPFQPDAAVWEIVLSACQKWGQVELGRQVFEGAVRLDRSNPALYILMSNIYAAAHMWEDAKQIQDMRLQAQVWKQQGQSWWTDRSGLVHPFVVGDRKHPDAQDIYLELRNLFVKMDEKG